LGDLPATLLSRRSEVVELKEVKRFKKELLFKLAKNHSYWLGRGVSERTITTFEGGTTFNGRMAYRYVFPIFDEFDNLVGFSGRRLNDNEDFPKWKHLGGKSHWLYPLKWNASEIIIKKEVILLESVGDMLALWEQGIRNTLVTFGVEISMKMVQFLLRADMNRILIGFNNDEGNEMVGNEAAEEGRVQLTNFFDEHQVVVAVPKFKDFGVMKPEEILEWKTQHQLN
jgi:DNA primase